MRHTNAKLLEVTRDGGRDESLAHTKDLIKCNNGICIFLFRDVFHACATLSNVKWAAIAEIRLVSRNTATAKEIMGKIQQTSVVEPQPSHRPALSPQSPIWTVRVCVCVRLWWSNERTSSSGKHWKLLNLFSVAFCRCQFNKVPSSFTSYSISRPCNTLCCVFLHCLDWVRLTKFMLNTKFSLRFSPFFCAFRLVWLNLIKYASINLYVFQVSRKFHEAMSNIFGDFRPPHEWRIRYGHKPSRRKWMLTQFHQVLRYMVCKIVE